MVEVARLARTGDQDCSTCGGEGTDPACEWDVLEGETPCEPKHPCPSCQPQGLEGPDEHRSGGGAEKGRTRWSSAWLDLGQRMEELRAAKGVSLAELAEALRVSESEIELIAAGVRSVSIAELGEMAEVLGVATWDLVPFQDN